MSSDNLITDSSPLVSDRCAEGEREYYCCALCENTVTTTDQAVVRYGNHYHDRTNPQGFRFLLACFESAPGCRIDDEFHVRHTWFENYAWALARCGSCGSQLGWYFRGDGNFFGLIVDRLVLLPRKAAD